MALLPDTLRADGLELRRWDPASVDVMRAAIDESFGELQLWMPWAQTMPTAEELGRTLTQGADDFRDDRGWDYSMFEARTGDLVGAAGLHRTDDPSCYEIGYWVRTDRTRRGYATTAAAALVEAAFRSLRHASQIMIRMDVGNLASAAVPPKLGFTLRGQEDREVLALGHTGRGHVWMLHRPT
jgi:ribosomal-protein-serine acetyltransferase